jgi:HAD superfamily hydrolase (TIGR01484 family)
VKSLIVFDLDGTLAASKTPIDAEMAALLGALLTIVKVAVISGGDWPQFETQLLDRLPHDQMEKLSLLPTCGTKFFRYTGDWQKLYSEDFSADEKAMILRSLKQAIASSGHKPDKVWGEVTQDRGSQITFSALGQDAPLAQKKNWDPGFDKRRSIKALLDPLLPDFSVNLGGTTSIDITRRGIDKAYGIGKLENILHLGIRDMIYIGDALFPGGNDYPAKQAGVLCIGVRDPNETKRVIEAIIACLGDAHIAAPCEPAARSAAAARRTRTAPRAQAGT